MKPYKNKQMMRILAANQLKNFLIYSDMTTNYSFIKRSLDICLSILGIFLTLPFYLVIYILIKREDGGPVIFKQERIGYGGKPFTIYKFRSMVIAAEKDDKPLLCEKNDKRMTKVGYYLREHHLDEIPQLWNILKGDMSLVGPRPERKYFVDRIISVNPDYELLYKLRPGIFSPATLYNGYTDTMEKMLERLRMDLEYMRNRSFWLDVKIIYLTLASLLTGKKF